MLEIISDCKIRLQQALDLNNMKAIDLAERLHISRSTVSQWLSGKTKPKRDRLVEIAEILSVDPSWLMGLDVPMEQKTASDLIYYQNKETAELVQRLFEDSNYRLLFDAAKDSKPEDIQMAADMLQRLKRTNPDG